MVEGFARTPRDRETLLGDGRDRRHDRSSGRKIGLPVGSTRIFISLVRQRQGVACKVKVAKYIGSSLK